MLKKNFGWEFDNGEVMYCTIPEGFRDEHDLNKVCSKFKKAGYGLKQAAKMFWNNMLKVMNEFGFSRSQCDPCVYYKWSDHKLVAMILWIDEMLCIGHPKDAEKFKT